MLEKAAIKRFQYSPLEKELKTRSDFAKQYNHGLEKVMNLIKRKMIKNQQLASVIT